jgi:hypothetical protein
LYTDTSGVSFTLLGNTFDSNSNLAIDLRGDGVTANDAGDADTGANNLQNFPVLTSATTDGSGQLRVKGSLNSTASSYYRIEFFANVAQDGSGYGEGQTWLGFANVATDASGNASIDATLSVAVPVGRYISATATRSDSGYSSFTDTSEFSRNVAAVSSTQASITVDTASDTSDGDTTSLSTLLANKGADGLVSLREAITAANNTANGAGGADKILFSIAGSGPHSIALASALPTITDAVIIDGSSEPDFAGTPVVELNGAAAGGVPTTPTAWCSAAAAPAAPSRGWRSTASRAAPSRSIAARATTSSPATIWAPTPAAWWTSATASGVSTSSSRGQQRGRRHDRRAAQRDRRQRYGGIALNGAAVTGNLVLGNYIGVGSDGTTALGNGFTAASCSSTVPQARIGGVAGEGNVIANNSAAGISVVDGTATTLGNRIYGNSALGIDLASDGVTANDTRRRTPAPTTCRTTPRSAAWCPPAATPPSPAPCAATPAPPTGWSSSRRPVATPAATARARPGSAPPR